jgi:hypothetical protein
MTTEETKLLSSQHSKWLVVFTSSQILVGTTANLCVIIYFLVSRQRKRITASDKMILNLAISDFIALTTYLPWRTHHLMSRERSEHIRVYASLLVVCIFSTGNAILCIAFDRFTAVVWPLRYKILITPKVSSTFIAVSWISAIVLGIMHGFSYTLDKHEEYELFFASISFAQLVILSCSYGVLFKIARRQRKSIYYLSRRSQAKFTFIRKSIRTSFIIMCMFYATYIPTCILRVYSAEIKSLTDNEKFVVWGWLSAFTFINSCCNPFLYFFGKENQRVEFVKSFQTWISKYSNDEDGCSRQPNNNSNEMEDKVHIDRQI